MLVLTRKRAEMIQIGEGIVIKIIHTGRSTVKIGIEAPADVRVMRAELCPIETKNRLQEILQHRKEQRTSQLPRRAGLLTPVADSAPCTSSSVLAK